MEKTVFYFDKNIGSRLPKTLSAMDPPFSVRWHSGEGFDPEMPDDEWLEITGRKGWVVLTQDWKFHIRDNELEAIRQHRVRCIYLPGADEHRWTTYVRFIRSHARLIETANDCAAPFIFDLKKNGQLRRIEIG